MFAVLGEAFEQFFSFAKSTTLESTFVEIYKFENKIVMCFEDKEDIFLTIKNITVT